MPAKNKPLTFSERESIERLSRNPCQSCSMIAKAIGRGKSNVVNEFRRSGGRETYTARKGQKYADEQQQIRKEKLTKSRKEITYVNPWQIKVNGMDERIQSLEMQIEILFDAIKSIKGLYD